MKCWSVCLTILILLNLSLPPELMAQQVQSHVVSVEELQHRLSVQSARRSQDIQEIRQLLRHDRVQARLGNLVDLRRVEVALATLDDKTLNQLADESRRVNDQIEAGIATWGWVLIVAIAAVTIIAVVGAKTWD